jgi:hypothetical protein
MLSHEIPIEKRDHRGGSGMLSHEIPNAKSDHYTTR